jgi:Flp pilus assembly protein CpaB
MKQKNLILMVVAVGCGLVAAFLTSQMSAKPKGSDVVLVDVMVASKELAPGTRFTKDSLKDQVKRKKYKPDEVPGNAVTDEAELIDKQLTKTLRSDDYVSYGDLGTYTPLQLPAGKDLITVRLSTDRTTPFLKAGSRIDIIGTGVTRRQQVVGLMVLPNVLVMAEGVNITPPSGRAEGNMNIQLASLAVTTEEAMLIRMCETANLQLSCILRSPDDSGDRSANDKWSPDTVKDWLKQNSGGELSGVAPEAGGKPQEQGGPAKVKLPVPTEDLPAGTAITVELIEQKFKEVEWIGAAPENAVTNMKEHLGRFLIEKVAANQFVPKTYIGEKPKGPPAPAPQQAAKQPDKPKEKAKPKDTFDRSITTAQGTKWYRYEKQEDGQWKLLGEVKEDGTVVPVQGNTPPPPAADDKKKPAEPDSKKLT